MFVTARTIWDSMIRKIAKVFGWIVGGLVSFVVLLYLIVLAINWRDKEPSAAAVRFETLHRDRPTVADGDNAYIFMLGLGVSPNEEVYAMGLKRKTWLEAARDEPLNLKADPLPETYDYQSARSPIIKTLLEQCRPGGEKCAVEFDNGDATFHEWLEREGWLLTRYQELLKYSGWLEPPLYDVAGPLPSYQIAMDGQRLLLAKAKLLARNGDVEGVKLLLDQDVRFWRMALRSSDILISKMIATVALNRHFELGNVVLRQLPPDDVIKAMPAVWKEPISNDERSMLRCFVGEWLFQANTMQALEKTRNLSAAYFSHEEFGIIDRISERLWYPLFQHQDTTNKSAEHLWAVAHALDVSFDQFEASLDKAESISEKLSGDAFPPKSAYNIVGNILLGIGAPVYLPYAKRVADIEGTRRAALAAVLLRQARVNPNQVAAELEIMELRHPFSGASLEWDAASGSIVFSGIEEGGRRVHRILY